MNNTNPLPFLKEFFNTLAGKLTGFLAFALLLIVVLGLFGAGIPETYRPLVYGVVIFALVVSFVLALYQMRAGAKAGETPVQSPSPSPATSSSHSPVSLSQARESYLRAVVADNRFLRLSVLDERAGDPGTHRLSLERVYVTLYTTTPMPQEGEAESDHTADVLFRWHRRPLSVLEALQQARNRRMVLLGLPGTGKSTFVRYLALMMAKALLGQEAPGLEDWKEPPRLPVALSLGRFAESLPPQAKEGRAEYLEEFLRRHLASDERTRAFAPHLLEEAKTHGALFLFDGLDEVADLNLRPVVVQSVEDFAEKYAARGNSLFLVTCRTYSYQDPRWQLTGWEQHELALFTREQIEAFVRAWYEAHREIEPARAQEFEHKRRKLLAALHPRDPRQLHRVARYPIILTVMAVVHASYELPDSRAEVYDRCVRLLLERWNVERSIQGRERVVNILEALRVPRSLLDQALWEVAYQAHRSREMGDEAGGLVTEGMLAGVLQEYFQDPHKVQVFLDYCASANGLLMLQGQIADGVKVRRVYTFPHLTFEEYLAARYLSDKGGQTIRELLDEAFDRWQEVARFLGEHLSFATSDRGRMNDLLEHLLPKHRPPSLEDWRALWLAGELLTYHRRVFPKPSPHEQAIQEGLLLLLHETPLGPRVQASAADILDALGYQPDDLYDFVPIPMPDGTTVYMARYPVTNAQYRRFLEAEDFGDPELWKRFPRFSAPREGRLDTIRRIGDWGDAGWRWLQEAREGKEGVVFPRFWEDADFGMARPSAPVVGVTWWEAMAYARWVQRHWKDLEEGRRNPHLRPREVRLPTEHEWVVAAGGLEPEGRYPWDREGQVTTAKEDIVRRANVMEAGIGRTTPVWAFPLGAAPSGVMDLAGNVWEWMVNFYDEDLDALVLKGGGWDGVAADARVAVRDNYPRPHDHWDLVGFRLLLLPE